MHELVYYSIFAIILYFVLSSVFETFSAEQENFDPSLVPVSSIVTLAKVAQKLVNGNGTLTNPGNLQIGASASAPGNLTVTGNSTVGGNSNIGGTVSINNGTINLTSNGTGGLHFLKSGTISNPTYNSLFSGPLAVNGDATVNGNIQANGVVNSATLGAGKIQIGNWAGRPALWANDTANSLTIHNDGNKTVQIGASNSYPGNLVVTGSATVNGSIAAIVPGSTASTMTQQPGTVVSSMDAAGFLMLWGSNGALIGDSRYPIRFGTGTNTGAAGWNEYARFDTSGHFNIGGNGYASRNLIVTGNINMAAGSGNNGINIVSGNPYIAFTKTGAAGGPQIYSDGTTLHAYNAPFQVDQNLTVSGSLISGDASLRGNVILATNAATNGVAIGAGVGLPPGSGGLRIGGQFCINNTCINEDHLKMLNGTAFFSLHNKRSNQQLLDEPGDIRARVSPDRNNAIQSKWRFTNIGSTHDNII